MMSAPAPPRWRWNIASIFSQPIGLLAAGAAASIVPKHQYLEIIAVLLLAYGAFCLAGCVFGFISLLKREPRHALSRAGLLINALAATVLFIMVAGEFSF